jgi:RNA polymerase sigma factor (sigma-70 family)
MKQAAHAQEIDEAELLEKFRQPESRNWAFNQLLRNYQQRVYHHIRKLVIDHDDADDLVQETFLKVYQKLDSFRGESSLFTWIYRIATNEALGHLRKKRKRFFLPLHDYSSELAASLSQNMSPDADDIERKLQQALLKLPDKQRLVFNMRYYEELPYEQMAEITGTSVGALKASYHLASKKIEEFINLN